MATKTIDRLPDADGRRTELKFASERTADPQVSLRYLVDEEYAAWDELVRVSPQGSVFSISWWVKAVNARVLGLFKSGRLVAGIPLYYERRMGVKMCRLPKLTQTFGVVMEPLSGKRVTMTSREMEILTIFAEHLAKERVFYQCFHPSLINWLPFLWNRFQQTSRFTYVLDDLSNLDAIWDGMEPKVRNVVRKARTLGIEVRECDADTVFALSAKTFARQGMANPFSREYLARLVAAAQANNSAACLGAADQHGQVHAAAMLVWDPKRAYYLVAGGDPDLRGSGAQSLLTWEAIQFASKRSAAFDFEGSNLEPIEGAFRQFGGKQVPYNCIMKFPLWLHTYLLASKRI